MDKFFAHTAFFLWHRNAELSMFVATSSPGRYCCHCQYCHHWGWSAWASWSSSWSSSSWSSSWSSSSWSYVLWQGGSWGWWARQQRLQPTFYGCTVRPLIIAACIYCTNLYITFIAQTYIYIYCTYIAQTYIYHLLHKRISNIYCTNLFIHILHIFRTKRYFEIPAVQFISVWYLLWPCSEIIYCTIFKKYAVFNYNIM